MAFINCNLSGGGVNLNLLGNVETNGSHTFSIDAKHNSCILIVSAAANCDDGVDQINAITFKTNGTATQIFEKLYSDGRRANLWTRIYLIKRKDEAITIALSGCKVWGIYTATVLG